VSEVRVLRRIFVPGGGKWQEAGERNIMTRLMTYRMIKPRKVRWDGNAVQMR
jgi:hypothetical protein